jgi:hypothetical protein
LLKYVGLALWLAAAPAAAQERKTSVALGYALATELEEGGMAAPLGAFLSVGTAGRTVGFEIDVAYHHYSREILGESFALNSLTAAIGPRFELRAASVRPFLHLLGGLRYDDPELADSYTALGGMTGAGVDIPFGSRVRLRLGGDLQIFHHEEEFLETLRFTAGIAF